VSADGHLADNHRLKFVLCSLPANDCNHGIQFGRIDCAISLTERLGDAFKFDTHHRRTRRAKSRHELGAPAVQVGMLWALLNLSFAVFRLDLRAHIETGLHLGDHLLSCGDGAFLGFVGLPNYHWQRL